MQRVALVTGGGSGIGRTVAETLLRDGLRVAIAGRRKERLTAVAESGCEPFVCDVADPAAVGRLAADLRRRLGRLDVVVNSAGVVRPGPFESASQEDIAYQIGINLVGTMNVCQATLPMLRETRGCIVNIGSTLAQRPGPGVAVYAASKGGIEAFTRALAIEVAPDGVRVNVVAPALVRTEIYQTAGVDPDSYAALVSQRAREYPLGRVGEPEDVAELVSFLASERASWLTGGCYPVDGGSGVNSVSR